MPITGDDAKTAARLARLDLNDEDLRTCAAQLSTVLDHFGAIRGLDTANVPPMHLPVEVETAFRKDVPGDSLPRASALGGATGAEDGLFTVPKVLPPARAGS